MAQFNLSLFIIGDMTAPMTSAQVNRQVSDGQE
jgi:hypothetical protein